MLHLRPPARRTNTICLRAGQDVWTNMGAAAAEYLDSTNRRVVADLADFSLAQLFVGVHVAGATGATLKAQYNTDLSGAGGSWVDLTAAQAIGTTGWKVGAIGTIPAGGRGKVLIRLVGTSGDGAADPLITYVGLYVSQT